MSDLIRNVDSGDIQELVRINDLAIPAVNSISSNKFEWSGDNDDILEDLYNTKYFQL